MKMSQLCPFILIRVIATLAATTLAASPVRADLFGTGTNQFTIDFTTIGNPGNANDTHGAGYGRVEYEYRIGTYEVSRAMVTAANNEGSLGLTLQDMTNYGGNGVNRPATGLHWNEAARFVNWLNTSQGYQRAYNFVTSGVDDNMILWPSTDAWQLGGENLFRHQDAHYFLPNENEWYKAAYYDPVSNRYFDFATGSDTVPVSVTGGTAAGTAVYDLGLDGSPADIMDAGGLSPYGTMAQNGNGWEWTEDGFNPPNDFADEIRALRGCFWGPPGSFMHANFRSRGDTNFDFLSFGLRVASVSPIPEPSALAFFTLVATFFLTGRWLVNRYHTSPRTN